MVKQWIVFHENIRWERLVANGNQWCKSEHTAQKWILTIIQFGEKGPKYRGGGGEREKLVGAQWYISFWFYPLLLYFFFGNRLGGGLTDWMAFMGFHISIHSALTRVLHIFYLVSIKVCRQYTMLRYEKLRKNLFVYTYDISVRFCEAARFFRLFSVISCTCCHKEVSK